MIQIVEITGNDGRLAEPRRLAGAEAVHRQLRPALRPDYSAQMTEIFLAGARMAVAIEASSDAVVGVAVWRLLLKTRSGLELYVDDLVTDDRRRSTGIGTALLHWLENRARAERCRTLALDSGTQRHHAHRFYFRERMAVTAFRFTRELT